MYANLRNTRRRLRRANASQRGFSLVELAAVIVIIGVFAAMAAPSFSRGRDEAVVFNTARRYQQLLMTARSRAAGTGSAHLALLGPGAANRGFLYLYAALDGVAAGATAPFNPVSSCKVNATQWNEALTLTPPIQNGTAARFVDFVEVNLQQNVDMDLKAALSLGGGNVGDVSASVAYLAICITPAGVTYVGGDATPDGAITNMRISPPFTGIAEIQLQRHDGSGNPAGLRRHVMLSGGGDPRLRSD